MGATGLVHQARVAERWAKNRVETIIIQIKRKWSKLCKKWMCSPGSIGRNEVELTRRCNLAPGKSEKRKKNSLRFHFLKRKVQIIFQEISKTMEEGDGGTGLYLKFSQLKIALSENICESLAHNRAKVPATSKDATRPSKKPALPKVLLHENKSCKREGKNGRPIFKDFKQYVRKPKGCLKHQRMFGCGSKFSISHTN